MVRLIDAEKLIKAIEDFPNTENGYSDTYDKEFIISEIEAQPTVDAVPVVHSSWEILNEHEEYVYGFKRVHDLAGVKTWAVVARCNKCGFVHYFIGGHMCYCYCPNCGADMRGDNG